jgi:colanic acid/amylovoran biosynthesis protein
MFNLGDDLFLDILAKKFPYSEFTINYLGKNYDQFISHYKNLAKRKYTVIDKIGQRLKISNTITNYAKVAQEHDALLFLGGSIFREEEYHHSLYQDRLEIVREFKKRDKPFFILGANFGPFESVQFFNDYNNFFKLCDDICFRDLYSYDLFNHLPQVRYAPDIVFQMNVDKYKGIAKKNSVGFSIIDVRHKYGLSKYYNDYISSTVKSIELLVKKGYVCYLLSFCESEGDLEIINTIISHLPKETLKNVSIYNYRGDIKEAISLIASFNLLVAARFHANILAMLLGIGVMPIIYSPKTANMLKDINFNEILISMETLNLQFDSDILIKSFNNKASLGLILNEAKNHYEKLSEFLKINSAIPEEI